MHFNQLILLALLLIVLLPPMLSGALALPLGWLLFPIIWFGLSLMVWWLQRRSKREQSDHTDITP